MQPLEKVKLRPDSLMIQGKKETNIPEISLAHATTLHAGDHFFNATEALWPWQFEAAQREAHHVA